MRIALLTLVVLAFGAAPAAAVPAFTLNVEPADGARLGDEHRVTGLLIDDGRPLPGQLVTLEARPAGAEAFIILAVAATRADGSFSFRRTFDRNQVLRVRATGASPASARAVVYPDARLRVRTVRRGVVRLEQSFPARRGVPVRARTSFYLGRRRAATAPLVARARLRRAGARYVARTTVRVPAAYRGRFAYAACLQALPGSALGDAEMRCPRRSFRLD